MLVGTASLASVPVLTACTQAHWVYTVGNLNGSADRCIDLKGNGCSLSAVAYGWMVN